MASDFLFELGCEELPSAAVAALGQAFQEAFIGLLAKANLSYESIRWFATPRRLALLVTQLQAKQASVKQTRRGPALIAAYDAEGKPTKALLGFATSCQVDVAALTEMDTDKGKWLVYESTMEGAATRELLPSLIEEALKGLPVAKPMRWGASDIEFARPIHWILMLYGNETIAADILGVTAGNTTTGHRFHHPQSIVVGSPDGYEALLAEAFVIADFSKRRDRIIDQVQALAHQLGATAKMPEELIDEVCSIVEWPNAMLVDFSPDFLAVPAQALIASMQSHQKCFALQDAAGKLLPHFITVCNIASLKPAQVIAGNEKVMRARLSDAAFFYEQDKKHPLSDRIEATKKVIFQARLGTLYDKSQRMQAMMQWLSLPLELDPEQAIRAASLSKCDLLTGMVGEFPELQGLMGFYYARHDGEFDGVALALNEQYLPRFAGDALPDSPLGLALSLSDRLDTLVGIFAIGQKPSGVKDPFKCRRHALAVVRLLLTTPAKLSLADLITESLSIYGGALPAENEAQAELKSFILERLQSHYQAQGVAVDIVHAVRARQDDWLFDFDERVQALSAFVAMPEAAVLSAACKRVGNLLNSVSFQVDGAYTINENLLEAGAEQSLYQTMQTVSRQITPLYAQGDYKAILTALARLRETVDAFFDGVMVMVEEHSLRTNRLHLLASLQTMLQGVADISLLQLKV